MSRDQGWRILFEGFSCAGEDRKVKESDIGDGLLPIKKKNIDAIVDNQLPPWTPLAFKPVYNNNNMWESTPENRSNPVHVAKLMKTNKHTAAHYARCNATINDNDDDTRCTAADTESVIVGNRCLDDKGVLQSVNYSGGNASTAAGAIILVCSSP